MIADLEAGIGTLTRANGRFIILNVAPGTHELRAERIGMGTATQNVTVVAGQTATVDFASDQDMGQRWVGELRINGAMECDNCADPVG